MQNAKHMKIKAIAATGVGGKTWRENMLLMREGYIAVIIDDYVFGLDVPGGCVT